MLSDTQISALKLLGFEPSVSGFYIWEKGLNGVIIASRGSINRWHIYLSEYEYLDDILNPKT
jgi:hypothetical protein